MEMIDDLPIGIFPEAHPESCYQALRIEGLACTRLNAELFYEMDQLGRNRRYGCSTEELREIDLWDPCAETSIWSEPAMKLDGQVISPEACQDNLNRVTRWYQVEYFLGRVYEWCQAELAPELVPHRNRRGQATWRFHSLSWTEAGIKPVSEVRKLVTPAQILQAAWNYLFWCRRRWLTAYPGKVWLSEPCLHLIRTAFRALLLRFTVPVEQWPPIKEEPKAVWPGRLEAQLAELLDREERAIRRLNYLSISGRLTGHKLRQAIGFLDDLAEEINRAQRGLDEEIVKQARQQGYDDTYSGTRLDLSDLTAPELLELKEEMRQLLSSELRSTAENS